MNKLVSRSPVQRFKEGKVLKYQNAPGPLPYKRVNTVDGYGIYTNDGGKTFIKSPKYRDWDPSNHINDKNFSKEWAYIPEKSKYAMFQGRKYQRVNDNEYWDITDIKNPKRYTFDQLPFKYVLSANAKWKTMSKNPQIINREEIPEISEISVVSQRSKNEKPSQTGERATIKKVSTPSSVFAGHKIGTTGGLNYNINDVDKQQLIGTGQFTESDFTDAMAAQQALNRYFANSGLGSVTEDGAWGDQSRAALALALSKSKSLTPFNNETTVVKTPIIPTYTPPITPNLNLNIPTYITADRSQTRDWMRSNGINPYSVTGAMRAAARRIRAGQADDNDRLLVKGNEQLYNLLKGYYKQGGNINKLPSRNIIERFKLQKGNKLPNAPKAEDRFKNGVKDSVAYLGVPGKDNTYFGESIKRVTTPDNAKIQRQVLFRHYPNDNDTIYREVPEHSKYRIYPIKTYVQPRQAFSYAKNPEYEVLKRRFNTAWNLAK